MSDRSNTTAHAAAHAAKDRAWENAKVQLRDLRENGLANAPAPKQLFRPVNHRSRLGWHCGDSRLWLQRGIRSLGSGDGMSAEEWIEAAKRLGLTEVSFHPGCHYWKDRGGNEAYQQFVEQRALAAGLKIVEAPLMGSEDFHDAHCLFIDGTGKLELAHYYQEVGRTVACQYVPQSFILTQAAIGDLAWDQAKTVVDIAMSEHGHGLHRFSKKNPFAVVGIADPNPDHLTSSISHIVAGLERLAGSLGDLPVVYHPFTAPAGI